MKATEFITELRALKTKECLLMASGRQRKVKKIKNIIKYYKQHHFFKELSI